MINSIYNTQINNFLSRGGTVEKIPQGHKTKKVVRSDEDRLAQHKLASRELKKRTKAHFRVQSL